MTLWGGKGVVGYYEGEDGAKSVQYCWNRGGVTVGRYGDTEVTLQAGGQKRHL